VTNRDTVPESDSTEILSDSSDFLLDNHGPWGYQERRIWRSLIGGGSSRKATNAVVRFSRMKVRGVCTSHRGMGAWGIHRHCDTEVSNGFAEGVHGCARSAVFLSEDRAGSSVRHGGGRSASIRYGLFVRFRLLAARSGRESKDDSLLGRRTGGPEPPRRRIRPASCSTFHFRFVTLASKWVEQSWRAEWLMEIGARGVLTPLASA
jgi:hypothetical protein